MSMSALIVSALLCAGGISAKTATPPTRPPASTHGVRPVSSQRAVAPASASASTAPASASAPVSSPVAHATIQPAASGECASLPKPRAGLRPFASGETLNYQMDLMGVQVGGLTFEVRPGSKSSNDIMIPIRLQAESNTFFSKIRRIKNAAVSTLRSSDLRPTQFHEDLVDNKRIVSTQVNFLTDRTVNVDWKLNDVPGHLRQAVTNDALDYLGAIYLFRSIPLNVAQTFCFDAYAMRRMWRVQGKVEAKEHLSLPVGEFDAFHLSGTATRIWRGPLQERKIDVWISDDQRRLPLMAAGIAELGALRATLSGISRADMRTDAKQSKAAMEW